LLVELEDLAVEASDGRYPPVDAEMAVSSRTMEAELTAAVGQTSRRRMAVMAAVQRQVVTAKRQQLQQGLGMQLVLQTKYSIEHRGECR
jgi:hypothetical protein